MASAMIDPDNIRHITASELHNLGLLADIEREVLSYSDEDDRNHVCYALTVRLINEGLMDQAERFTRLMEAWPIERTWSLGDIASQLWHTGQTAHALALLDEAISISRTNGREWQRAEALSKLATHLAELGQSKQAIILLQEAVPIAQLGQSEGCGQDIEDSASVIRELAEKLAVLDERGLAI
jgi:tetratricopeptide (TPR) repeat protein